MTNLFWTKMAKWGITVNSPIDELHEEIWDRITALEQQANTPSQVEGKNGRPNQ